MGLKSYFIMVIKIFKRYAWVQQQLKLINIESQIKLNHYLNKIATIISNSWFISVQ
jgi:hypothetical protein